MSGDSLPQAAQLRSPKVDFDHHSQEFRNGWQETYDKNLAQCPVAWTDSHDGFWVFSGYEPVSTALRDNATYSSYHDSSGGGAAIPPTTTQAMIPLELDPPASLAYRKLLNPIFSPQASKAWEPYIQDLVTECLDQVCESGRMDVLHDLTGPVTATLTLAIVGMPTSQGKRCAQLMHDMTTIFPGSPEYSEIAEGFGKLLGEIAMLVPERRAEPKDDLISRLATATIDGRALSVEEVANICSLVIAGGVETTASLVAHALRWLSEHPKERQLLINDPDLIPQAREEFLRLFTPVAGMARTATARTEIAGATVEAGDRVFLMYGAANRDPAAFDEPGEARLDRFPNRHVTFGVGSHRCVGAHLARAQIEIILRSVLARMPDFVITEAEPYPDLSIGNGFATMKATFTPTAGSPVQ